MKRRPAFVIMDMIVGFALVAALGTMLAIGVGKMRRTSDRLAGARAMDRAAESAMIAMQRGKPFDDKSIKLTRVEATAPQKQAWVELTVTRDGRQMQLVGLVPETAIAGRATP